MPGHGDPEREPPWVMQLVVHLPKINPPTRTAVCEAAAAAVASLLMDDRALGIGEWAAAVERWNGGRIRKHCRRARGAAWDNVQLLPGVTVHHAGAQVRAFVPSPMDDIPRDIAKLQLAGSEIEDPGVRRSIEVSAAGPVVVSICPDPVLSLGKAAAAAGHAGQLTAAAMSTERLALWSDAGLLVVVEHPDIARWASLLRCAPVLVTDGGLTEVAPGTVTALARWA